MKDAHPKDGPAVNNKIVSGKVQELKGEVEKEAGQVTGNKRLRSHGEAEELKGTVKTQVGQIEVKIDHVTDTVMAQIHEATNSDKQTS